MRRKIEGFNPRVSYRRAKEGRKEGRKEER
jgi:hypothetical protein